MLDELKTSREADVDRRRAAFENAAHSLEMEGRSLDPKTVAEFQAVIEGKMSFDEAARSIAAKGREPNGR